MKPRHRCRSRSGIALTLFAVILLFLLSFIVLAVDTSFFFTQQAELQVAATAAAAGAALDLPDGATDTALRLAEANMPTLLHGAVLTASGVELGNWNDSTRLFTSGGTPLNAVRVTTSKSSGNGNGVPWLFGRLLGRQDLDLSATATAALLPELPGAIGSTGSISVSGNASTDSYDSTEGPYDPAEAGDDGDLVADGSLSIGGSAVVNGDVKGGSVSSGGGATVTGSISPVRRALSFPPVDTSEVELVNDNDLLPEYEQGNNLVSPLDGNRNFSISSGLSYEIPPGTYYFNDLSLSGQASLNISGPTTIYLTGDLDTSGGDVINSSQDPNSFRILMTGGTAVINASIDWYGLLYAPNSEVTVNGSGDVYGAIVGADVEFSGTGEIHFDVSLTVSDIVDGITKRSAIVQ